MSHPSSDVDVPISELDARQLEMMINENVFVVDNDDKFIRIGSKKESMILFSIFVFFMLTE
jgi:hypothetical protein